MPEISALDTVRPKGKAKRVITSVFRGMGWPGIAGRCKLAPIPEEWRPKTTTIPNRHLTRIKSQVKHDRKTTETVTDSLRVSSAGMRSTWRVDQAKSLR